MITFDILNNKQALIEGDIYPIRKVGDSYRVYIADETKYGRHWIVLGKDEPQPSTAQFDETKTSSRLGVPSGTSTKSPRITLDRLLEILDEGTRGKVQEAIAKIQEDAKVEREKTIKENKIAKLQEQLAKLMAE